MYVSFTPDPAAMLPWLDYQPGKVSPGAGDLQGPLNAPGLPLGNFIKQFSGNYFIMTFFPMTFFI